MGYQLEGFLSIAGHYNFLKLGFCSSMWLFFFWNQANARDFPRNVKITNFPLSNAMGQSELKEKRRRGSERKISRGGEGGWQENVLLVWSKQFCLSMFIWSLSDQVWTWRSPRPKNIIARVREEETSLLDHCFVFDDDDVTKNRVRSVRISIYLWCRLKKEIKRYFAYRLKRLRRTVNTCFASYVNNSG